MCGILGCISQRIGAQRFEQALRKLEHRGPFGSGHTQSAGVRLGMTRLPMSSEQEYPLPPEVSDWLTTYNGEVYQVGRDSGLPGEIGLLINSVERNVSFPDGMYAFALLDPARNWLHLGRDVLGMKPLYYSHDAANGEFAFASELPALLHLLGPQPMDMEAVADVVATGATLEYRTMFRGIQLLPPGTLLSLDLHAPKRKPRCRPLLVAAPCRELELGVELASSIAQCADTFREVGLLLSGGIDSNLINSFLPSDAAKFHVAVADSGDHPQALPSLHVCHLDRDDFWGLLRRAVSNFAAPTRMSSILMYQRLADLVRKHGYYCVLLGEGADELFLGYPRHLELAQCYFEWSPRQLATQYFGDFAARATWLAPAAEAGLLWRTSEVIAELCADGIDEAVWRFDLHYSLEPLLRRADHLLMSQTVEARLPFLHNGVPTLARNMGRKRLNGSRQKAPLQELIRQRLPAYRIEKKSHFRLPFAHWSRITDEMTSFLMQRLDDLGALGLSRLHPGTVGQLKPSDTFTLSTLLLWRQAYSEYLK